jgi:type IV secretion system protein VirB6/type IV secretion system protein TrbL
MVKHRTRLLACALCVIATDAQAQVDNSGVLDQALNQYRTAAESWQNAAQGAATTLFWSLAAISLAWTMGQLVLRRADLSEFFAELIRYLLFTGFWAWMLSNGPAHAELIVDSMVRLASSASAQNRLTPSGILDVGFHILDRALTQSTLSSPLISTIGIVVALGILVVLALAAVNMLVTLIACWIVAYGGLIILGFGGSRWTSDMAINYYRMVLSLGLQVLAMILLVGMGESFLRNYFNTLKQDVSLHELAVLLVVSLVLLMTVNRIPPMLGTLASGSSPQYALGSGAGATAAMSAISTAGGLAAWSQATVNSVAGGAARLALGAGSIVKAMASAAETGGTRAAMTSLFDGFRSSADPASSVTGRTDGGSVFRAAGTSATSSTAASPTTSSPPRGTDSIRQADGNAARALPTAPTTAQAAQRPAQAAHNTASTAANDSQHETAANPASVERKGTSSNRSARSDSPLATAEASDDGAIAPTDPPIRDSRGNPPPGPPDHDGPSAPQGSSKTVKQDAGTIVLPPQPPDANSSPSADAAATPSSRTSPAGTFAQPTSAASIAPTTVAASSAPTATPLAAPPSGKPTAGIADATRSTALPQDILFSTATGNEPTKPPHAPARAASVESTGRSELPAAYSDQTSVDIEAEVAAFRDRD